MALASLERVGLLVGLAESSNVAIVVFNSSSHCISDLDSFMHLVWCSGNEIVSRRLARFMVSEIAILD